MVSASGAYFLLLFTLVLLTVLIAVNKVRSLSAQTQKAHWLLPTQWKENSVFSKGSFFWARMGLQFR